MTRLVLHIVCYLLLTLNLQSQCSDRGKLWNRIIYLRDTLKNASATQLSELSAHLDPKDSCSRYKDSTKVLLLQRVGWLHTETQDYLKAVELTKMAINLAKAEKYNPAINLSMVIKSYHNLYLIYNLLQIDVEKTSALDSCIYYAVSLKTDYLYALSALDQLVPKLFAEGDYFRCISMAALGESIVNETSKSKKKAAKDGFNYFSVKINALIEIKNYDTASRLVSDQINFAKKYADLTSLVNLYGLYATLQRESLQAEAAIKYYRKCFRLNKLIGYRRGCAEALNNIGYTYSSLLKNDSKAIPYYFEAIKYADANERLNVFGNIANAYSNKNNFDLAFFYFQRAFDQYKKGCSEKDLLEYPNDFLADYTTNMILDKAAARRRQYQITKNESYLKEALNIYHIVDKYSGMLQSSQSDMQSKLFWKESVSRLYEQAIECCYESDDPEQAFYFFERSRSVLLNDEVQKQRRMSDADLLTEADLKRKILEYERKLISSTISQKERLEIQQEIFTRSKQLEALQNSIFSKSRFSAVLPDDTSQVTIPMLRRYILQQSGLFFEIFYGNNTVFVFGVTKDNVTFEKIDKAIYDSLVNRYNLFVSGADLLNSRFSDFISDAHGLYKLLFSKINFTNLDNIIISPDGKSFPIESLILNTAGKTPDFLLFHFATSYTYSAQYLKNQMQQNTNSADRLLGIAPVAFKNYPALASLTESESSLEKISSYLSNTSCFFYENASRQNFVNEFPKFSIVQLYTHASDSSTNKDPVIYFSDSAFYLSDLIAYQKPITKLVVLSACQTANGKLYQGEGIFSFSRGFAAMGIPSAVSNLWSVDNKSTYQLTEIFYKFLSQGYMTDAALQKAKIEFIQLNKSSEKKLPYYWAASILTGKADKLNIDRKYPLNFIFLAVSTVLIIIIILMFGRRRYFQLTS